MQDDEAVEIGDGPMRPEIYRRAVASVAPRTTDATYYILKQGLRFTTQCGKYNNM